MSPSNRKSMTGEELARLVATRDSLQKEIEKKKATLALLEPRYTEVRGTGGDDGIIVCKKCQAAT